MVEIREATVRDVTWLAANARMIDRREWTATVGISMGQAAHSMVLSSPMLAWTAWRGGDPIAAFGVSRAAPMIQPQLGCLWGFGTDDFYRAAPAITRTLREHYPLMEEMGLRRVEARCLEENVVAARWMERACGGTLEARMPEYGIRGETFLLMSWTAPDWGLSTRPSRGIGAREQE